MVALYKSWWVIFWHRKARSEMDRPDNVDCGNHLASRGLCCHPTQNAETRVVLFLARSRPEGRPPRDPCRPFPIAEILVPFRFLGRGRKVHAMSRVSRGLE